MSENTETKPNEYQETPGGLFKAGNPGKPKGAKHLTTKLRQALEKVYNEKEKTSLDKDLINTIIEKAIVDKDFNSIKLIFNYIDGMPEQSTDLTSGGEKILVMPQEIIDKYNLNATTRSPKEDSE